MQFHKPSDIAIQNVLTSFKNSNALSSTGSINGLKLYIIFDDEIPNLTEMSAT